MGELVLHFFFHFRESKKPDSKSDVQRGTRRDGDRARRVYVTRNCNPARGAALQRYAHTHIYTRIELGASSCKPHHYVADSIEEGRPEGSSGVKVTKYMERRWLSRGRCASRRSVAHTCVQGAHYSSPRRGVTARGSFTGKGTRRRRR